MWAFPCSKRYRGAKEIRLGAFNAKTLASEDLSISTPNQRASFNHVCPNRPHLDDFSPRCSFLPGIAYRWGRPVLDSH